MNSSGERTESLLARALGHGQTRLRAALMALGYVLLFATPLLILADRSADVAVPLLGDFAMLARVLIALPIFILAVPHCDSLIDEAIRHAPKAALVSGESLKTYERWQARLARLRSSRLAELLFVVFALGSVFWSQPFPGPLLGLKGWGYSAAGELNAAGLWYCYAFLPVFRLVMLLWMWRLFVWTVFLGRLAFMKLNLNAAHPDGAGGIGYIGFVQQRLSLVLVAGGFMLAGSAANRMAIMGEPLYLHVYVVFGLALLYPALLLAPLLLTTPHLLRTKRDGIFEYGLIGQDMTDSFRRQWVEGSDEGPAPGRERLESPNPSAMADFETMHSTVQSMGILPISYWGIASMVAASAAPLLLLIFLRVPLDSLLKSVLTEVPPFDLVAKSPPLPTP